MSKPQHQNWDEACLCFVQLCIPEDRSSEAGSLEKMFDQRNWWSLADTARFKYEELTGKHDDQDYVNLLVSKQRDYGHENILKFGEDGLKVRIWDKIARINNLLKRGGDAANEPLKDSWLDLMGYVILLKMFKDDTFILPLAEDVTPQDEVPVVVAIGPGYKWKVKYAPGYVSTIEFLERVL